MSGAQIVYCLALAAVFAMRGPSFVAWVLLANLAATLLACLAMDMGLLGRANATLTMMLIDLASGAVLAFTPGLPRIVAAGYAITVPIYALNLLLGVQIGTTFAIVNAVAFIQIAVVGIGAGGDDAGNRRRFDDGPDPVLLQGGNTGMARLANEPRYPPILQNRGG